MSRREAPPRVGDWLARSFLDAARAERLLADLRDEYAEYQLPTRGPVRAGAWYVLQVLTSIRAMRAQAAGSSRARRGPGPVHGPQRRWTGSVRQDLRYAMRQLRRAPVFASTAGVTLALGIGATTAIFSVVHSVLLEGLPYDAPERILRAWAHTADGDITDFSFRVAEYEVLRDRTGAFEAVGAEFPISLTVLPESSEARQIQGRMITADFFRVFGVEPALGRPFTADEIAGGDRPLALITHEFWTRHLGADPDAVDGTLDIGGTPFTVMGVLPEGYVHVSGRDAQVFIPYTLGTAGWVGHWLDLYVRVQPGVTAERAGEEINAVLAAVGEADRRSAGWHATVESLHEMVVGDVRSAVWATFAMVGLVLLIACVNVANLALARSTTRQAELSVRRALGAGRGRLIRQLLVENLVLALVGGFLGLLGAAAGLRAVVALAPPSIPRIEGVSLDPVVLGFSLGLTLATVLLFGSVPAIRSSQEAVRGGLARRPEGARRDSLGGTLAALVVSEVALALVLLVGAGLLVRTQAELRRQDLGFRRGGAATFRISVPAVRYPTGSDTDVLYTRLRRELAALPSVTAVGAGSDLPVSGEGAIASVTSRERVEAGAEEAVTVLQRRATAGFFRALGTSVVAGREFDERDRPDGTPVAILSASLARALFPAGDVVGREVGFGVSPDEWMTVVGVVDDVRYTGVDRASDPQIYQAHPQSATRQMAVVVRTDGDPLALVEPARAVVHALDPLIPVYEAGTLGGLVDRALAGRRFTTVLFTLFGAVALVLTLSGVYGVLAFAAGRRRREIGVRMALGARRADVTSLVLGQGMRPVILGLALGTLGALAGSRWIEGQLYGVPATDPVTYAAVALLLVLVAALAAWIPARRAARTDPMGVLRDA